MRVEKFKSIVPVLIVLLFVPCACALFEDFGETKRKQIPPSSSNDDDDDDNGGGDCLGFPPGGFNNQVASIGVDDMEGGVIVFTGANFTSSTHADQVLSIEIFESLGAYLGPGVVDLNGQNANYATCSVCVMMHEDVDLSGSDINSIGRRYMAVDGTLTITDLAPMIDGRFAAVLSATFVEVTVDTDYDSHIVEGGCETGTDSFSFSTTLMDATEF